jgi:hypothetical protein
MPQASDERPEGWGTDDAPAIAFLEQAGYRLMRGFVWKKPTPEHQPTAQELSAICFLADEWDFGGIVG